MLFTCGVLDEEEAGGLRLEQHLLQAQRVSVAEVSELAGRLRRQRNELREAQERLQVQLTESERSAALTRSILETAPPALAAIEGDPASFRVTVLDRRGDPALDPALMSASLGLLWGLQDVLITSPLLLARNEVLLGLAGLGVGAVRGEPKVRAFLDHLPIASLLGVRYLLTTHDLDDPRLERLAEIVKPERTLPAARAHAGER